MESKGKAVIPDWETNHVCFSSLLPEYHGKVWADIRRILDKEKVSYELLEGTRDIWARDYMPIQVTSERFVQFTYNPDYLSHNPELLTKPIRLGWMKDYEKPPIVLDGGNLICNRERVIVTDKVYRENPNWTKHDLWKELERLLKAEVVIVPARPYEVTGHIDGVANFLDEKTLLVTDLAEVKEDEYLNRLLVALENRFKIQYLTNYIVEYFLRFRFPTAEGCYINYLRVANVVLVPFFGPTDYDSRAVKTMRKLLPLPYAPYRSR